MKKLSVLILEDGMFKYHHIKTALEECCLPTVSWAGNVEQGLELIAKARGEGAGFDLIITDMHYPLRETENANPKAGMVLMQRLKEEGVDTPVILCSSDRYEINQAFACIWYSEARSLSLDLREVIMRL